MKALLSLFLITVAFVMRPTHGSCTDPYYVNGTTPSGTYQCRKSYSLQDDCTKGEFGCLERVDPTEDWYLSKIYCTNGMIAVQDGHKVWCARRPAI